MAVPIDDFAFQQCENLKEVVLPAGLNFIGREAFLGNTSLTSITIPDGVTGIDYYAFTRCINLTDITLPASVAYVAPDLFWLSDQVTIHGSTAQDYAEAYGIPFVSISDQPELALGHVTGGEDVRASDALVILQAITAKVDLTGQQRLAADVNGDGYIKADDALLIMQYTTKKIETFPVEIR